MRLRPIEDSDLSQLFEFQLDPEAVRMTGRPPRERDAFMTHWRTKVLSTPSTLVRAIEVDGRLAGNVFAWEKDGCRWLGYGLGRAHWGRGTATAAVRAFLVDVETSRPLHAYVADRNKASMRVLEKCGFRRVGDLSKDEYGVDEWLMLLEA